MGKYTRNSSFDGCSGGVMEVAVDNSKRRKVNGELKLSSSKLMRITSLKNLSNQCDDDVTSFISGDVATSCCSSSGSVTEKVKSSDLENKNENEIETSVRQNSETTESTQSTEVKDESSEVKSAKAPVLFDSRRAIPPEKTPPAAELEEFFAAAEKDIHKSFKDKYNYDVVNDVPLKGRYEWVELKE